jgi:hypothetical protein
MRDPNRPRAPILITRGAISLPVDPAAEGAVPRLVGPVLLELAPGVGEVADREPVEFDRIAGRRVSPDWMWPLAHSAREALADAWPCFDPRVAA